MVIDVVAKELWDDIADKSWFVALGTDRDDTNPKLIVYVSRSLPANWREKFKHGYKQHPVQIIKVGSSLLHRTRRPNPRHRFL